jgi:glycosyltransferase involved in cell wall biosynthesis
MAVVSIARHAKLQSAAGAGAGRLILDITSIAQWSGPPVGIIRVEQQLASYARARRPDIVLAFNHPSIGMHEINPAWADAVIDSQSIIDPIYFIRRQRLSRLRRWMPSRYPPFMALERVRLQTKSTAVRSLADVLQRLLLLNRRHAPFVDARGDRIAVVPLGVALGPPLSLGPRDTVVSAGFDWLNREPGEIVGYKRRLGFRWVVLCYDIIPLTHPEFYSDSDVKMFREYWTTMFSLAERTIFTSRRVESDARRYCEQAGIRIADTAVVSLGHEPRPHGPDWAASLPAQLEPNRFALFVSTVEPRKGHALLLRVWRRLLAEGVPQRNRFNLVFVGRQGWKVDALLRQIDKMVGQECMLRHFADVRDTELTRLYQNAAFCLYPSILRASVCPSSRPSPAAKPCLPRTAAHCRKPSRVCLPASIPWTRTPGIRTCGGGSRTRPRVRLSRKRSGYLFRPRHGTRLQRVSSLPPPAHRRRTIFRPEPSYTAGESSCLPLTIVMK